MRKTRPEIPDPFECQGPDIKVSCILHIQCASAISMSAKSLWCAGYESCCLIDHLTTNGHISSNKTENVEEFDQSVSNLIRTRFWFQLTYSILDQQIIFSVRSTPYIYMIILNTRLDQNWNQLVFWRKVYQFDLSLSSHRCFYYKVIWWLPLLLGKAMIVYSG